MVSFRNQQFINLAAQMNCVTLKVDKQHSICNRSLCGSSG
jgi:hypothetical protein